MKPRIRRCFVVFFILIAAKSAFTQEENTFSLKASAELVSSYIWRGIPAYSYNNEQEVLAPNIQPTLGFVVGGFEIGAWGSSDFTGSYKEMDLYASYSYKQLTATFTDYYWDLSWLSKPYFSYQKDNTSHIFEGMLSYKGTKIPLSISVATMLYGADKKFVDNDEETKPRNNYSTYIELGYNFKIKEFSFDALVGVTPADGLYGDGYGKVTGFGVVNLGVTGYRKLQISEKYETTLRSSLIFNPQQDKSYLVLGITF
jgi:hypothetical protein